MASDQLWVMERGSVPSCWCPLQPGTTEGTFSVIVGMNLIADDPPGEKWGEFWYDEDGAIHIRKYEPR